MIRPDEERHLTRVILGLKVEWARQGSIMGHVVKKDLTVCKIGNRRTLKALIRQPDPAFFGI